ncbi:unnamed protein product [Protopolystoma xenopodis]|uniref:Uncharacterized protein n=1 Tax=Protopolystoma xenopodis TaxID=117903 RepID=A0A448WAH0_9PLAT|nr:unnamed protein product [Protopolystoma xenopodis]
MQSGKLSQHPLPIHVAPPILDAFIHSTRLHFTSLHSAPIALLRRISHLHFLSPLRFPVRVLLTKPPHLTSPHLTSHLTPSRPPHHLTLSAPDSHGPTRTGHSQSFPILSVNLPKQAGLVNKSCRQVDLCADNDDDCMCQPLMSTTCVSGSFLLLQTAYGFVTATSYCMRSCQSRAPKFWRNLRFYLHTRCRCSSPLRRSLAPVTPQVENEVGDFLEFSQFHQLVDCISSSRPKKPS